MTCPECLAAWKIYDYTTSLFSIVDSLNDFMVYIEAGEMFKQGKALGKMIKEV